MAEETDSIRIVKKKKGHAGHHGGAWKVAYADFVTAMMAFFLVMWIMGLDKPVQEAVAGYFQDPSAFMEAVTEGATGGGGGGEATTPGDDRQRLKTTKETIEKMVAATPEFEELRSNVEITLVDDGLRIDLLDGSKSLFFDSASSEVKPNTAKLLRKMAVELSKLPNKVILEGHTDSLPLAREDGYSNWELSADRANSARCVLEAAGMPPEQTFQVRGYAANQPRDPKHPEHFSNRRVSIIVVLSGAEKQHQFSSAAAKSSPSKSH